ncbi:MAG: DNA methyltransferase, partial [Pyrinomonadaceae bacterium]
VLIVTIDEHEVHHLRVLLDEMLREAAVQMVTAVINPKGVTQGRLSRVEEHIIFCFNRSAKAKGGDDDLLNPPNNASRPRWKGLLRSGDEARRQDRAEMFYPVLIDESRGAVIDAGEPLSLQKQPIFGEKRDGFSIAWPVRSDGSLGRWGVGRDTLRKLISTGYVAAGRYDPKRKTFGIAYLSQQLQQQIESGELEIVDHDEQRNVVDVVYSESATRKIKTVWHRSAHDAGAYGADILSRVLGRSGAFSFPKSVYAVRDTLACVTRDKKDALVVDFFAGSGTTLHALNLLNATDGGRRRCIPVTNNEVSEEEARRLTVQGHRPGELEWAAFAVRSPFRDPNSPSMAGVMTARHYPATT